MPTVIDPFLTEEDIAAIEDEALLDLVYETLRRLAEGLDKARSVQWTAPVPEARVNGQPSNPTAEVASDPTRLALRLAVLAGERTFRESVSTVLATARDLEERLRPWTGPEERETPDLR